MLPVLGIKYSVSARANGTGKKAAVRTAAARIIEGLNGRLDLRRGVFMRRRGLTRAIATRIADVSRISFYCRNLKNWHALWDSNFT
jgi:hypothetical protein